MKINTTNFLLYWMVLMFVLLVNYVKIFIIIILFFGKKIIVLKKYFVWDCIRTKMYVYGQSGTVTLYKECKNNIDNVDFITPLY